METKKISDLPLILRTLLYLLEKSNLEGEQLAGTFLTLKEMCSWTEMENWILWLNSENPTKEQIMARLERYVITKGGYDGRGKPSKTWDSYPINDMTLRKNETVKSNNTK